MQLSVREVAALLHASERQIYRWVDQGEIPFQRVRQQVRFNRTDVLEWATSRGMSISLEAFDAGLDPEDRAPSLAEALRAGGVHRDVPSSDRETAIREIVERTPMPPTVDRELVAEVLAARAQASATPVGGGIAIPHVRQPVIAPGAEPTASVSYLASPVRFDDAPDGEPIRTMVLLVSPTIRTHLQMLAHVMRALLDPGFRAALDRGADLDELVAEAARVETARRSMPDLPPAPAASEGDD
ncbi:MAG: PTS sugar transporter subunit IIA [Deltaproteobacteria bacterium]|nr:PTS sugar transporter subunit IIA [Deltaproteobacteria bacterium]